jgi:hypothetical protein
VRNTKLGGDPKIRWRAGGGGCAPLPQLKRQPAQARLTQARPAPALRRLSRVRWPALPALLIMSRLPYRQRQLGLGLGNGSQCIHEPVLDLGRVDDLDNLSPFGEQTNFSHFANELQASDPLRWGPIWIKRVFC